MPDTNNNIEKKPMNQLQDIKDKLGYKVKGLEYTPAGRILSDVRRAVRDGVDSARKGYVGADVFNFGDRLAERQSKILEYLSGLDYEDDPDGEYAKRLKEVSVALGAYCDLADEVGLLGRLDGIGEGRYDAPIVRETLESIEKTFRENWVWIGQEIYGGSLREPAGGFLTAGQPVSPFAKLSTRKHPFDLPTGELRRTSDILYEFAHTSYGHPDGYRAGGHTLKDYGEGWDDEQALASSIFGNPDVVNGMVNVSQPDGSVTIAKNGAEPDYNAWIEDVTYAADVLDTWADWLGKSKDGLKVCGATEGQVEKLDGKLREEFERAWGWIGENVLTLWN